MKAEQINEIAQWVEQVGQLVTKSIDLVKQQIKGSQDLDLHQVTGYQLVYGLAEVTTCRSLLDYLNQLQNKKQSGIEFELAGFFIAESINTILGRLQGQARKIGLPLNEIFTVQQQEPMLKWMDQYQSAEWMSATTKQLQEAGPHFDEDLLGEIHSMAQASFRKVSQEVIAPRAEEIHRQDLIIPEEILQPLRELGTFGLCVPEAYGGLQSEDASDTLGIIIATEELSQGSLCAGGGIITRPEIFSRALLKGGTEEQKQYWLPKIASGEKLGAIAVTEPDYGSDVASIKLKATKVEGGWKLNGAKAWSTFAGRADVLLLVARTSEDPSYKGISMFFVEKPTFDGHEFAVDNGEGGRLTGKATATIGYRGMHSFDLFFEDFFVPDSHLIGGEQGNGKGFYFIMAGFEGGRIQTAARATGVMRAAYREALQYTQDRKVFGKAVADYQLSQWKLIRIASIILACKRFSCFVATLMDEGKGQMEASLVKLFACKNSEWVSREAMQLHGGMGYAEETAVSRHFVDARVLSIFEGAEETLALKVVFKALMAK